MGRALRSDGKYGTREPITSEVRWPSHEGSMTTSRTRPSPNANWITAWHNATPEEDYRTALLSDSPDAGCSLSHHGGGETAKRPRRQAGLRYSAGRAQGGGVVSSEAISVRGRVGARTRTRDCRPSGRRARGTNIRRSIRPPHGRPAHAGPTTNKPTTYSVAAEICTT